MAKKPRRNWYVNAYKQRVSEANELLGDLDRDGIIALLGDEWGGLMSDSKYFTKKGRFRRNAKLYNISELENLIDMLDVFLDDAPQYHYEGEKLKNLEQRLGGNNSNANANALLTLMDYMKESVRKGELSSDQMRDIAKDRLEKGQSIKTIKNAFLKALQDAHGDPTEWFNKFSSNGNLI